MKSKTFKVRLADTNSQRNEVGDLIDRMYSRRGYQSSGGAQAHTHRVTLVASADENTLATITIGFDSAAGLLADELYKDEIDELRRRGKRLLARHQHDRDGGPDLGAAALQINHFETHLLVRPRELWAANRSTAKPAGCSISR